MPSYSGPLQTVVESTTLWLVPLLPILGAILNAAVGWRLQRSPWGKEMSKKLHIGSLSVSGIAISAMAISFGLAVWHVVQLVQLPVHQRNLLCHMWPMVRVGSFDLSFDLSLDPISAVMLLVVTGVGLLIHVYATGYMETEPSYWRFFSYLNLFIFAMLLLVLGDNFFVMFFGWEGVGLCSYLLIGFWYKDYKKASAGTKAFLTNRVGDFGFLAGLFILLWSLSGSWTEQGYQPDVTPRLVPVVVDHTTGHGDAHGGQGDAHAKEAGDTHGKDAHGADAHDKSTSGALQKAYITFTSFPGAKVYINGDTVGPLVAPFVRYELPLLSQRNSFVVAMGGATEDLRLDNVELAAGKETILSPVGMVLSFRDLSNQLVIQDTITGKKPFHERLGGKTLWGVAVVTLACLGFFIGATGKSAQIPLYVWLPDAMAGPTPVSALIHAATMVTSGVYMVARLNFLFSMSPTASGVVALVGASTALFAATIGFFQYDIKKVLAYSTVSQLGFMFIGVGVGVYWAGIFHVMTHAFFKACLFLTAGSVIHGMHAVEHDADRAQDMRVMGGLKKRMPLTRLSYLIACLAITAAPIPMFAGFWSKDEILWRAFTTENTGFVPGMLIWAMGLVAALGTSFYMWRSYYLTFEGPFNWTPEKDNEPGKPFKTASKKQSEKMVEKVHESPAVMTYVLLTLAGLSTVGGALFGFSTHYLGYHHGDAGYFPPVLEHWLHPVTQHAAVTFKEFGSSTLLLEHGLMWGSVVLAIGAWALARKRYGADRPKDWEVQERALPGWKVINAKYYVDEIYDATVIRGVLTLRLVLRDFDKYVVDGIVNFAGVMTKLTARIDGAIDHYLVDGAVNLVAQTVLRIGSRLRRIQTGQIQNYAYGVLGGVATLAVIMFLIRYYGAR
jgi:NADH-quinone oxidoreductase subunit L